MMRTQLRQEGEPLAMQVSTSAAMDPGERSFVGEEALEFSSAGRASEGGGGGRPVSGNKIEDGDGGVGERCVVAMAEMQQERLGWWCNIVATPLREIIVDAPMGCQDDERDQNERSRVRTT